MAEHDRFMETKVSPLFFKTNLANLHESSVIIGTLNLLVELANTRFLKIIQYNMYQIK